MATLHQLKTFIAVAEYKKMSTAAKHLYISQPTVSQIIADLESEYQTTLFERLPKELQITSAGLLLLNSAKQIIAINENLEQSMKNIHSQRPLRIGATLTIGNIMIAGIVEKLIATYPDIDVSVCVDNTQHLEELLIQNKLDIALVEGIINRNEIISTAVLEDNLCLICGPEHPFFSKNTVSVKELQNENFIMREKGSGTRAIFETLMSAHNVSYNTKWESNSSTAIIDAVHHNLGLGFLSERCVLNYMEIKKTHICNIAELSLRRYFYLSRSKFHPVTSQMQDFINEVMALEPANND